MTINVKKGGAYSAVNSVFVKKGGTYRAIADMFVKTAGAYRSVSFSPMALFTTGVNGAWLDPSDFSTMFQDAAGTTPVTAVGQPVGRILDKSGRSNHAFNPSGNSANFPVLSARYNLLTKTEDFSDAVWTKDGTSVTTDAVVAPDGTLTADSVVNSTTTGNHRIYSTASTSAGVSCTQAFYVKANGITSIDIADAATANANVTFNLSAGTFVNGSAGTGSMTALANGWYKCAMTWTASTTTSYAYVALRNGGNTSYTGDGTSGVYIWGADLRVINDALNQPAYQRVNTATDYNTVGFKPYLSFNGVNQWLQTNSIDFTYGDKMFVCAGVRKLSDAATAIVAELSADLNANNGTFYLLAPVNNASSNYAAVNKGTVAQALSSAPGYAAPTTSVLSMSAGITTPALSARINGVPIGANSASQGTGNYGSYPLYIGARAGTSLWFNGRLYGLVVAGKAASVSEIASTETWLNQKTGAY